MRANHKEISLSFLFLVVMLMGECYALDSPAVPNQRFELTDQHSAESALESYNKTFKELQGDKSTACSFGTDPTYRCVSGIGGQTYLPPFPFALPSQMPSGPEHVGQFSWAPVTEVRDGPKILAQWRELAKAGSFFDCKDYLCMIVVHSLSADQDAQETLDECTIFRANGIVGAPRHCTQIAILTSDRAWIKVVTGYVSGAAEIGLPDTTLEIVGKLPTTGESLFSGDHKLPVSLTSVLTATAKALSLPPLRLITQHNGDTSVLGIASYRLSPILSGWRELLTVRVDVSDLSWEPIPAVGVTISTTLYVNRQNTDRTEDWHLPAPSQEEAYLAAIRTNLKEPLESLCKRFEWSDSDTLVCHAPL